MCSSTLTSHKRQNRTVTADLTVFGSYRGTGIQPDLEVAVNLKTIERKWPFKVFYMIVVKKIITKRLISS